jgi:hypothetical protein
MTAVIECARIPLDVQHLWADLGRFGEVVWHPLLARVESIGNQPGALRHVETTDGRRQMERLDEIDPGQHLYRYTMQSSALPVANYTGELRMDELSPNSSLVTWSARFDVTDGDAEVEAENIRRFLRVGLDALQARYG